MGVERRGRIAAATDGRDAGVACRACERSGEHNVDERNSVANEKLTEAGRHEEKRQISSQANFHNRR